MALKANAFTLSEVLIVLALLGIVAAFSIPKILQSQANIQRDALFKESLGSLYDVLGQGMASGELTPNTFYSYFTSKLNLLKTCDTNSTTQGCYTGDGDQSLQPGMVLVNGVGLSGFDNCCEPPISGWQNRANGIGVDYNGPINGPNTIGQDQLLLVVCFDLASTTCQRTGFTQIIPKGTIQANQSMVSLTPQQMADNLLLFNNIFQ